MSKPHVLIIEDEAAIRDMLRFALPDDEFKLSDADDAKQAQQFLSTTLPDIILLDWMLPGKSGIEFIAWLKQQQRLRNIPVIMLTARVEEENKVRGLNTGADDYITKPFSPVELIARIKAVLRRGLLMSPEGVINCGELQLNSDKHQVSIQQQVIKLSPIDYKLLHFFMTHPGKTYSRDQLISRVWGDETYINERTVDVQIRRLRDQLKPFGLAKLITTIRGIGYQFNA